VNIEQAMTLTNMRKQPMVLSLDGQKTKTAKETAEMVFELSAAVGEPYRDAVPEVWASRWLVSKKFVLVDIDPRQVAVPYANKISRSKVMATMQASVDSMPPIVVDLNVQKIGRSGTGYIPSLIVVDGKNRHRAQMLCGRDRISAWVGEKALVELQARAAVRKHFVIDRTDNPGRSLSKIEIEAALMAPSGGSPVSVARQDTGDGGSRPVGSPHTPVRTGPAMPVHMPMRSAGGGGGASSGGGPGGGVSGMNPARTGIYSDRDDPSDRGQMLDPSDKEQFSYGAPKGGDPSKQSPGSGGGTRTRPSTGASNSEMSQKKRGLSAGPIKVKKITTDKKRKRMAGARK
jgi:hypothetical protein